MKTIELSVPFGNEYKSVKIIENSMGGGNYQIMIDNYYQGDVVKIRGKWQAHLNNKSELTIDDIQLLSEIVEKNK